MTGLQDAVQEYLKAPPANTLPHPQFALSLSVHLEEGLHRMLDTALLDQGYQEPKKNAWTKPLVKTATPKQQWEREEDEAGNILFFYPEFFGLLADS